MLILAKSILGLTLGFVLSIIMGLIAIPVLRNLKVGQSYFDIIGSAGIVFIKSYDINKKKYYTEIRKQLCNGR